MGKPFALVTTIFTCYPEKSKEAQMRKNKKTNPEKQPLDKKKQDLVNKIRKDKRKKDDVIEKACKKDKTHSEFWKKEKELGKPIQEIAAPAPQCTTSLEPCQKELKEVVGKEVHPERKTFWQWLKSIFSRA